jgi:hypothetical protein
VAAARDFRHCQVKTEKQNDLLVISHSFIVLLRLETGGSHRAEGMTGLKFSFRK